MHAMTARVAFHICAELCQCQTLELHLCLAWFAEDGECGNVSWPSIDTVVVKGLPVLLHPNTVQVQAGPENMLAGVPQDQVTC